MKTIGVRRKIVPTQIIKVDKEKLERMIAKEKEKFPDAYNTGFLNGMMLIFNEIFAEKE